jgi:hypothetical protein
MFDIKGVKKKGGFKFSSNFNAVFLQSVHLYELLMGHTKIACYFISKGVQILKFCIFERYIDFYFSSNFDVFFFFFAHWIILNAYSSMSTEFLYLLRSNAHFLLKFYFNGLQLNMRSYVIMNIIIFLKI